MEILFYDNRKADPICWDASTPEKRKAAILALFKHLDEDWEMYTGLDEYPADLTKADTELKRLREGYVSEDHVMHKEYVEKITKLEKNMPDLKNGAEQYRLLVCARGGDWNSAERLLTLRKDYEMEYFDFIHCADPLNL